MTDAATNCAKLPWRERWREVARYKYRDLDGRVLFEHVRWHSLAVGGCDPETGRSKEFTYRHRDLHGQTRIGLPDGLGERLVHVPYRLPDLARVARGEVDPLWQPSRFVDPSHPQLVIVEGEKDVHTLERAGFIATTAHGGAMHGWGEPETAWLREIAWHGPVWLVADNDAAGWLHARNALASFHPYEWGVRTVMPSAGKDASDAIAQLKPGVAWWKDVDPLIVVARGDAAERRLRQATRVSGGGGGSRVNGYLTPGAVSAWKAQQTRRLMEGDW